MQYSKIILWWREFAPFFVYLQNYIPMHAMNSDKIVMEGLTYDDVLLIPARSEVLPREVDIHTQFTRDITIQVPIVSAAMDTVTDANLAIAIAREGGIGVIHKNMPIEMQMEHVRKVKRAENGMIYDPVTIDVDACVGDALRLMSQNHIGGIPVVDSLGRLIGIVTNRDLRFQDNPAKPIKEVMTCENLITVGPKTTIPEATEVLRKNRIEKLPVVDEDNRLVGTGLLCRRIFLALCRTIEEGLPCNQNIILFEVLELALLETSVGDLLYR